MKRFLSILTLVAFLTASLSAPAWATDFCGFIKLSTTTTLSILLIATSDLRTGATGLTGFTTLYGSFNGGAVVDFSADKSFAAIDDTKMPGVYPLTLNGARLGTLGNLHLTGLITGGTVVPWDCNYNVVTQLPGEVGDVNVAKWANNTVTVDTNGYPNVNVFDYASTIQSTAPATLSQATDALADVRKNTALNYWTFPMRLTTGATATAGLAVTVLIKKDNGAWASPTNTASVIDAQGTSTISWAAADLNADVITAKATCTGCFDMFYTFRTR